MRYYKREDGTVCTAIQFIGGNEGGKGWNLFVVMDLLTKANLLPLWTAEEITDEWVENDTGDDYEQVVIPEHIKIGAGSDELQMGDYIVERDGDTYIMGGVLFEAIWTPAITDLMDNWKWMIHTRLPYAERPGFWEYKTNNDIVSMDGGVTYFLLSESPPYQLHGEIYNSVKLDSTKAIEQPKNVPIADICEHCGRSVVNFDTNGKVFKSFKHTEGKQRGLIRCWPEDTGQPYGLEATPRSRR
jgi:hypothetical protein